MFINRTLIVYSNTFNVHKYLLSINSIKFKIINYEL